MAYVVCEPCIRCRYTDCVVVCPVDCFREGENFLVIDPGECIDCGSCEPQCPTEAIFAREDVPPEWERYVELNERYARVWPRIDAPRGPLPDAEAWRDIEDKGGELRPNPGGGSEMAGSRTHGPDDP